MQERTVNTYSLFEKQIISINDIKNNHDAQDPYPGHAFVMKTPMDIFWSINIRDHFEIAGDYISLENFVSTCREIEEQQKEGLLHTGVSGLCVICTKEGRTLRSGCLSLRLKTEEFKALQKYAAHLLGEVQKHPETKYLQDKKGAKKVV